MFSNLDLYYLHQMGITPWIEKATHEPLAVESKINTALLLITSKLKTKEQLLLTNIRSFLGLSDDQLVHFEMNDMQKPNGIQAVFTLSFGFNAEPSSTRTESLSYFLENPKAKKQLFHDLLVLKEQLAAL